MDRVPAAKELSFRVMFTGHAGHVKIDPLPPVESPGPLQLLPDFILPPAFPEETPSVIEGYIKDKYLTPRLDEDIFSPENSGRQWEFDWFGKAGVQLEPSLPWSALVPSWEIPSRRKKLAKNLERWEPKSVEVNLSDSTMELEDSGALPRIVAPSKDFVRGSLTNHPFHPGGLENSDSLRKMLPDGAHNGEWSFELLRGGQPQVLAPGFREGLTLGQLEEHSGEWNVYEMTDTKTYTSDYKLNELSLQFDDLFQKAWEDDSTNYLRESDILLDPVNESVQLQTEDKLLVVNDMIKEESSLLDEVLSVDLAKSMPGLDGDTGGSMQSKQGWVLSGGNEEIVERFDELVPDMALSFPFELDPFQKEAIYHLERGDSVFVAAHTSAGKTVVAEYAFALATKHCTRAVYTAPIKTISNQKYRDFCGKFDVGLLTGDVSLRPEASCLIMTTEILRSMLYKGADIIRDIEWVIFDEVHYVNDVERGVVWEEVIIMLPRHINFILLSATVPNKTEFADWIGRTKKKKIHVTGTTKRPVPLEHFLFYSGELFKVCESEKIIPQGLKAAKDLHKKNTSAISSSGSHSVSLAASKRVGAKEENYHHAKHKQSRSQKAGNLLGANPGNQSSINDNWGSRRSEASIWLSLIQKLSKGSLLPVVIFCFSKNRCDKSADNLSGSDLTTSSEKSEIRVFCDKAFSRLKGSDRKLPQVVRVQGLLHRGIGVHHAGLLPIVKEVVEMLFCRGVVKILFSTETFAMGVNAPARTVVFDSLRKFDGKEFRQLLPGEYTQMAGRAGRRGLDKIGTVVVLCRDEILDENDLKHVMVGSATKLESQFRLTYIMILHLLRVEELKVEDMLKRSFAEFHSQNKLPEKQQLLMRKLSQPTQNIECIKGEPAIEEYYDLHAEAESFRRIINEAIMLSPVAHNFLIPGRVVVVKSNLVQAQDHLLGVIVKPPSANYKQYIVLVLTPGIPPVAKASSDIKEKKTADFRVLIPKSKRGLDDDYVTSVTSRKGSGIINLHLPHHGSVAGVSYEVRGAEITEFLSICSSTIKINQVEILEDVSDGAFSHAVQQLSAQTSDENTYPRSLDPLKDLKLNDSNVVQAYYKWTSLLKRMTQNKCSGCIKFKEHLKLAQELKQHKNEVDTLKFQMSDEALQQMPEFQGRIDVLKQIGCIDSDLIVQIKGRVACEMNSGEELICTECLFDNQFNDLEPEEAVAIMSAFVFQQKNASEPCLSPRLSQAKKRLYDTAIQLGELQAKFNPNVVPQDYAQENLKFGLVEVVYEWAKGTPFTDICELTDVSEGMIVRTIMRLDETCREFRNAAAIMGNPALYKKMETASNLIKRDVVFAASLYITGI